MFISILQTLAIVIVALTTIVIGSEWSFDERYDVVPLKINEREGFGERA